MANSLGKRLDVCQLLKKGKCLGQVNFKSCLVKGQTISNTNSCSNSRFKNAEKLYHFYSESLIHSYNTILSPALKQHWRSSSNKNITTILPLVFSFSFDFCKLQPVYFDFYCILLTILTLSWSKKMKTNELGQYAAILTSRLANNAYVPVTILSSVSEGQCRERSA